MTSLAARFDVIAPELAGFAGSAGERTRTSIEEHAQAIVELLDHLNVRRCNFVGHSMGGMIAQQIALDWPERVERLVLYGTACQGIVPQRFESLDTSIRCLQERGVLEYAERIVATWFLAGTASPHYAECVNVARLANLEGTIAALSAIRRWDVTKRLREIRVPTLVVCGDGDRSVSVQQAVVLWQHIGGARLWVVPAAAHAAHLDCSDIFNDVISRFLIESAV